MKITLIVIIALFLGLAGFAAWLGSTDIIPEQQKMSITIPTEGHIQ